MALECVDQRIEQPNRAPDPVGERRAREIDSLPGVDPRLPVEREMTGVLRHEHVREQPGARPAALDRHGGQRRLHDALARPAAEPRPDVTHDPERGRHIVELLGHVLADTSHGTATVGTGARTVVNHVLAWQVVRQRLAIRPGGVAGTGNGRCDRGSRFRLGFFEAHCIDQRGADVRSEYGRLGEVRRQLGNPPFLAFTAMAEHEMQARIIAWLDAKDAEIFVSGVDRLNITLLKGAVTGDGRGAGIAELLPCHWLEDCVFAVGACRRGYN